MLDTTATRTRFAYELINFRNLDRVPTTLQRELAGKYFSASGSGCWKHYVDTALIFRDAWPALPAFQAHCSQTLVRPVILKLRRRGQRNVLLLIGADTQLLAAPAYGYLQALTLLAEKIARRSAASAMPGCMCAACHARHNLANAVGGKQATTPDEALRESERGMACFIGAILTWLFRGTQASKSPSAIAAQLERAKEGDAKARKPRRHYSWQTSAQRSARSPAKAAVMHAPAP